MQISQEQMRIGPKAKKPHLNSPKSLPTVQPLQNLKSLKNQDLVKDSLLARQLDLIYNSYLGGQVDPALLAEQIRMETEISKKYSNFRANLNGKELTDNQIEDILKNSTSKLDLQAAWEGHKMIGPVVADDIIKLVKHRNLIAQKDRIQQLP